MRIDDLKAEMKALGLIPTVLLASALNAAAPDVPIKEQNLPRLIEVGSFPENNRTAIRAIITELSAEGGKPGEYFAEFWDSREPAILTIHLKHESHPAVESASMRGDSCGHCLVAYYNPKARKVTFQGIR